MCRGCVGFAAARCVPDQLTPLVADRGSDSKPKKIAPFVDHNTVIDEQA